MDLSAGWRDLSSHVMTVTNRLLTALPRTMRQRILERCDPVELVFGDRLSDAGRATRCVYFPLRGFISLVTVIEQRPPLEMGLIGNEGMLGATLALGVNSAPLSGVVQGSGSALRLKTSHLREELRTNPALASLLGRYLYVLMAQLSRTSACLHFHSVEARLARWLLMTHDRAHGDRFHLTHAFLADMLGVRRSAITIAAGALQRRKLIRYSRGEIEVLSRAGLTDSACECYGALLATYAKWLG